MGFSILSIVEKFLVITLVVLLADLVYRLLVPQLHSNTSSQRTPQEPSAVTTTLEKSEIEFKDGCRKEQDVYLESNSRRGSFVLLASAKGVAGIGKVGSENTGGSDKAGQQVPPEVYNALTYAGTAFLFTLSVPLILYSLNKLFNKIEDCFGCGPSSKKAKKEAQAGKLQNNPAEKQLQTQQQKQQQSPQMPEVGLNQQQQLQQQAQFQSKLQAQLSISNHNGNILTQQQYYQQQQQQQQNNHTMPQTLPFDLESNSKSSQAQGNFQQPPFMISPLNL